MLLFKLFLDNLEIIQVEELLIILEWYDYVTVDLYLMFEFLFYIYSENRL